MLALMLGLGVLKGSDKRRRKGKVELPDGWRKVESEVFSKPGVFAMVKQGAPERATSELAVSFDVAVSWIERLAVGKEDVAAFVEKAAPEALEGIASELGSVAVRRSEDGYRVRVVFARKLRPTTPAEVEERIVAVDERLRGRISKLVLT